MAPRERARLAKRLREIPVYRRQFDSSGLGEPLKLFAAFAQNEFGDHRKQPLCARALKNLIHGVALFGIYFSHDPAGS
ncbi:hypothetical protein [Paraburkholderia sp. J41]|uniref:hypothetical protein n=1 Tax=Paraburkholderia sp. J41 TaxID=2805433 RepID=UPI002AC32E63|nr:hypothetical protein [Paraburkholderia sp. J41]